jgi:hypothetical protein
MALMVDASMGPGPVEKRRKSKEVVFFDKKPADGGGLMPGLLTPRRN